MLKTSSITLQLPGGHLQEPQGTTYEIGWMELNPEGKVPAKKQRLRGLGFMTFSQIWERLLAEF